MTIAADEGELLEALESTQAIAANAFGIADVYIERYLPDPRHIEFQILADSQGNVMHLGERECSIQRRHQKLIEESPSPALDAETRRSMGEVAVNAARTVGYEGAGTVEFLWSGRAVLLPGGERPRAGGAPGDGDGHRGRHREGADTDRIRASPELRPGRRRDATAAPSSAASTPRIL